MRPAEFTKSRLLGVSIALAALFGIVASTVACAPITPPAAEASEEDHTQTAEPVVTNVTVPGFGGGSAGGAAAPGSLEVPVRIYEPGAQPTAQPTAPADGAADGAAVAPQDAVVEVPWATLVWAHGGSFMRGTLDWPEADWVARRFAEAGVRVLSVDYVLASDEVKAPAPSNDVAAVIAWAGTEYSGPLIAGGASAGAHLAVLATLEQLDSAPDRRVDALVLEYPTLHRVQRDDAVLAAAAAELPETRRFSAERIAEMYDFYLGESGAPVVGELPPEKLAGLPPVVIVNADTDELRASAEEFAEQLRTASVEVSDQVQPGTVHGYMNRPEESPQAREDASATMQFFVSELRRLVHT